MSPIISGTGFFEGLDEKVDGAAALLSLPGPAIAEALGEPSQPKINYAFEQRLPSRS